MGENAASQRRSPSAWRKRGAVTSATNAWAPIWGRQETPGGGSGPDPPEEYKPEGPTADTDPARRSRSPLPRRRPDTRRPAEPSGRPPAEEKSTRRIITEPVMTKPKCKPAPDPEAPEASSTARPAQDARLPAQHPGKRYGSWTHDESNEEDRPCCLHQFSGRQRKGDLAEFLRSKGWLVCSVDRDEQPHPTDLLDEQVQKAILEDVGARRFDCIYMGTPYCETYSALREIPGGPKPLRTPAELEGIREGLKPWERKKLLEGNSHTNFSANVMKEAAKVETAFGLENPEPSNEVTIFNMPSIKEARWASQGAADCNFDQCRFGCEATKPTRILAYKLNLRDIKDKRCNHPQKYFKDEEGKPYHASHRRVAGRKVKKESGETQWASKELAAYAPQLCEALAKAIVQVYTQRSRRALAQAMEKETWPALRYSGPGQVKTARILEEAEAIGGMRNPSKARDKLPESQVLGEIISEFLDTALRKCPDLLVTAKDVLAGSSSVRPLGSEEEIQKIRGALMTIIHTSQPLPKRTARANTPLKAEVLWGWAWHSDDPDAATLVEWLQWAPLGFAQPIPSNGVFPVCSGTPADAPTEAELARSSEAWTNWPSADEEAEEMRKLVEDATNKGFCHVVSHPVEVGKEVGNFFLNKLGVVVKWKGDKKKARIIWDLRESKVNDRCDQGERIILPRLLDVVQSCLMVMRKGKTPVLAAVDIQDAFHNIPAGSDKRFTVAQADLEEGPMHVIYDVLVFGAKSSPTIWGRYAAFLERTLAACVPEMEAQIYVDDPIFVLEGDSTEEAARTLTKALLWTELLGYPIKLSKAAAGSEVDWIGARLCIEGQEKVVVRIPRDKVETLSTEIQRILKAPVVGVRQLRSLAGSLSFLAGLVPLMRPFLAPLWGALAKDSANDCATKDEGSHPKSRGAGKLIHVKRIAGALHWIASLLRGEHGEMKRTFFAEQKNPEWELATDACPWGIGGVLYYKHEPKRWFASELTPALLDNKASKGDPGHNTLWEAVALLVACRPWLPRLDLHQGVVRVKSDNVGALQTLLHFVERFGDSGEGDCLRSGGRKLQAHRTGTYLRGDQRCTRRP